MKPSPESHPVRTRTEPSRMAILRAAIREFAEQGESGARTDAIAQAAGVNKALIHYYFGTKDGLYGAVLDEVFQGLTEHYLLVLNGPGSEGERLLRYVLAHFDHLAGSHTYSRLLGHEMMRARSGQSTRIARIVAICFGPLHEALHQLFALGIASGELRQVDPGPVLLGLIGVNVFYFISAPFYREIAGKDPRAPEQLARQRTALLDSAATLLFTDPVQGRLLAERIQSQTRGDHP